MLVFKDILGGSLKITPENSNNLARQKLTSKESLRFFTPPWRPLKKGPENRKSKIAPPSVPPPEALYDWKVSLHRLLMQPYEALRKLRPKDCAAHAVLQHARELLRRG